MDGNAAPAASSAGLSAYRLALIFLFVVTLPLINPWVRGDGVGYYAYARSILIQHNLDFRQDWLRANTSFRMARISPDGRIAADQYTATGHLDNHFSVGPAILWAPFLIAAHAGVLMADRLGAHVAADGFSRPYILAISLGTALYGFLSVMISFALASRFAAPRWAFLAALGIWFGSSLPVYMYFDPSWSHAQSAFTVAVFIWYWIRTRTARSAGQWAILGALAGLMMDVYYVAAVLVLLPMIDSLNAYWKALRGEEREQIMPLLMRNAIFSVALATAFLPTLLTKKIVFGGYLRFGYTEHWFWNSPALLKVCFSPDHGLFTWTPVLVLAVAGLVLLLGRDRSIGASLLAVFASYLYLIGCYQNWHGIASYGNRFFVGLTPLFIIGLAVVFERIARAWPARSMTAVSATAVGVLVLWNLGLMFQWGMHLIPPRGPISWRDAAYNQVAVVPRDAGSSIHAYLIRRSNLMQRIEQTDVNELKSRAGQTGK